MSGPVARSTATGTRVLAAAHWRTALELGFLGAVWGASFIFMRIAAPEFGAVPLIEVRVLTGALVLLPFLWLERSAFVGAPWPKIALIGVINTAVPFTLFAWAAQRAPAGIGAITNSMAVLFTALVAFLFWRERIGRVRLLALCTGFAGVAVLAIKDVPGADVAGAVAAGTAAAFLYGVAANLITRHLRGLPPIALACATLIAASLVLLPVTVATWPATPPSGGAWFAAIILGVVCTGAAYAVFFRLIQRIGAPRTVTVTYLIPVFAVFWAWLALGEPLTLPMAIAGALILGSVAISQRAR